MTTRTTTVKITTNKMIIVPVTATANMAIAPPILHPTDRPIGLHLISRTEMVGRREVATVMTSPTKGKDRLGWKGTARAMKAGVQMSRAPTIET